MTLAATLFEPLLLFLAGQTADEARAQWPKGPTAPYRGNPPVPIAHYISWLETVEASPALTEQSAERIVQRMRRLYFSRFTEPVKPQTSTLADNNISDTTTYAEPPLTTDHVDLATLNGLYGTSAVSTPRGLEVDIAHLWMPADVLLNGRPHATTFGEAIFLDTPLVGLFSWAGDLGGVANDWSQQMVTLAAAERTPATSKAAMLAHVNGKAKRDDILGDMDGAILAKRWASLDSFVVSAELRKYYKDDDKPRAQSMQIVDPNSARRFHHFLKHATPSLPADDTATSPLEVSVTLDDLAAKLKSVLSDAADDLVSGGTLQGATLSAERTIELVGRTQFDRLCINFAAFLKGGLTNPKMPWPPVLW